MSALENIRKGLSSSGSTLIVGILIVGLVATFGNFLGTDNAFSDQKVLEINGQDISIQEFSLRPTDLIQFSLIKKSVLSRIKSRRLLKIL